MFTTKLYLNVLLHIINTINYGTVVEPRELLGTPVIQTAQKSIDIRQNFDRTMTSVVLV